MEGGIPHTFLPDQKILFLLWFHTHSHTHSDSATTVIVCATDQRPHQRCAAANAKARRVCNCLYDIFEKVLMCVGVVSDLRLKGGPVEREVRAAFDTLRYLEK